MATLPFTFDYSCPYAYLASTQVEALAARAGASLELRPILLGGIFRARATPQDLSSALPPAKARHNLADMHRHAALFGVPLSMPPGHPNRTVTALRATLAAGTPIDLVHRFFEAYWARGLDLSEVEVTQQVLNEAGLDAAGLLTAAGSQDIKDELRARTDQALADGVFGVPAFVIGGELYWGQDRLDAVERALGGTPSRPPLAPIVHDTDLWFDFSSPYAYIGSEAAEEVFGDRVSFRPMLLGAVFGAVGTPNVPMLAANEAKQAFLARDIRGQAAAAGVELRWPSRFPLHTVLPLRVVLLVGPDTERGRALIRRLFRLCWVEDGDPSDPEAVAAAANEVGLDGSDLVARASEPSTKQLLRDSTSAALEAGVFGAPTWVVGGQQLFWGSDRLEMARLAASGDERLRPADPGTGC